MIKNYDSVVNCISPGTTSSKKQIDKWLNATKEKKKSDFILPSFNIKG